MQQLRSHAGLNLSLSGDGNTRKGVTWDTLLAPLRFDGLSSNNCSSTAVRLPRKGMQIGEC